MAEKVKSPETSQHRWKYVPYTDTGTSHSESRGAYNGTQDALRVLTSSDLKIMDDVIVAAVADGATLAPRGKDGADLAVQVATNHFRENLQALRGLLKIPEKKRQMDIDTKFRGPIISKWRAGVKALKQGRETDFTFATTYAVVAVTDKIAYFLTLGDIVADALVGDELESYAAQSSDSQSYTLADSRAGINSKFNILEFTQKPTIILATDGALQIPDFNMQTLMRTKTPEEFKAYLSNPTRDDKAVVKLY